MSLQMIQNSITLPVKIYQTIVKTRKEKKNRLIDSDPLKTRITNNQALKQKTRKRNRTINNNDEPNERNTKFIKVVETNVGEKTDESVVDIKDNGNNSNSNGNNSNSNSNSNTSDSDIVVTNNGENDEEIVQLLFVMV